MKKYIKPISECIDSEMTLPIMMSLHDEIGDGQLANSFDFEEEDAEDVNFPPFINVKKEITGNKEYYNYNLALKH